jgi:hypothetical protein
MAAGDGGGGDGSAMRAGSMLGARPSDDRGRDAPPPPVHRVPIPPGAIALVRAGDAVALGDPLVARRVPGSAFRVSVARGLGRRPDGYVEQFLVHPGTRLEAGEAIARDSQGREVRTPRPAIFVSYRARDGSALLIELGPGRPLVGHVRGGVVRVAPHAIDIALPGVRLLGVGGIGEAVHGELMMAVNRHDEELRAGSVDVSAAGKILVGGSRASAETLTRARAMGAVGVVLGGVLDKELRDLEVIQRRRRDQGGLVNPFAVVLLEGYGKVALDPHLFEWLRQHQGRTASLFGTERVLVVYDASEPPRRVALARVGDRVVAHGRPHAGRTGVLVGLLDELHAGGAGIPALTGLVRFEDGRLAPIPLANLEASVAGEGPVPGA